MKIKPLLILDLNGNLLISQHRTFAGVRPNARARTKYLYFRPHMEKFLHYAFAHFRVAIWSSNSDENTQATANIILTEQQLKEIKFIWGRSHCEVNPADYSSKKDLTRIFTTESPDDVIIVDDSPEKIIGIQNVINYMQVKSYEKPDPQDNELLLLIERLNTIRT